MNGDAWVHASTAQQVVVGSAVVDALPDVVKALGARRVHLVTSPGRADSEIAERVLARLGRSHADTSAIVERGVPATAVQRGVMEVRASGADALLALGGGSAIDTAKALAFFAEQEAGTPAAGFADRPVVPIIAVPTTLVGAAFTGTFSMLDPNTRRSSMAGGPTTVPMAVLADLDPLADLGEEGLLRSAGAAIAQAVDVSLDPASDPEARAVAIGGIVSLLAGLDGRDLDVVPRALLDGAVLAGRALQTSPDGLQRSLVRLLGARTSAAHGALHLALLPHTTRVLADVVADAVLAPLTRAFGGTPDDLLADVITSRLTGFGPIPGIGDLGIDDDDVESVARQSTAQRGVQRAARPLGESDVRALIEDAW